MATKKTPKAPKSNPKEGQNAQDIKEAQYLLKSLNPLPAIAVSILKLVAPILARIAIRQAISYAVKKKYVKAQIPVRRDAIANAGAIGMRAILENILQNIQVE